MGSFTVTPDTFPPASGQLRDLAGQLDAAWQPVRSESQAVTFGRGDDPVSPLIQASLHAAIALIDNSVSSSVRALHSYADGLDRMGRGYAQAEQETTAMLHGGRS